MLDKDTAGIIATAIGIAWAAWEARSKAKDRAAAAAKAAEAAAQPKPPLEIPEMRPGDDPIITVNRLIRIIVTEHADREAAELAFEAQQKADREKFHRIYSNIAEEQNRDRAEIQTLRGDLGEARKALDNERTERRKLANELAHEVKQREGLAQLLNRVQHELTIALADNGRLIKDNERLTADNTELRKVNGDLMNVIAEQRQAIAAKDQQIDQLMGALDEARNELELSTELLKQKVGQSETGGISNG